MLRLPSWLSGKESAFQAGDMSLIPGSGRFPWRRRRPPVQVILPGKSHGWRSLVGYSPWGCRVRHNLATKHTHTHTHTHTNTHTHSIPRLFSCAFLSQICVGQSLTAHLWLLLRDGVVRPCFRCRTPLSPSQHISLFTPGWVKDHLLCTEAALESPLVLVQGEEVACTTGSGVFRAFLRWPFSALLGAARALGPGKPDPCCPIWRVWVKVTSQLKERAGLSRLLHGGLVGMRGRGETEERVRFWKHFKGRATQIWWLIMYSEQMGWRESRVPEDWKMLRTGMWIRQESRNEGS